MVALLKRSSALFALVIGALFAPLMAHADGAFDTSAVTTAATTVATIGGVVFLVYVAIKVTKWARSAL